jgi:hypothetical protein
LTTLETTTNKTETDTETMAKKSTATMMKTLEKIKLNPPTPFTRKRSDFILFMQDVYVYLKVNKATYDNDDKKISFILSYLTGGDAAVWKQQFIQTKIKESEEAGTDKLGDIQGMCRGPQENVSTVRRTRQGS